MSTATASPILEAIAHDGFKFVGLTVRQYDSLIEQGMLPSNPGTELIDGLIVEKDRSAVGEDPFSIGDRHRTAVLHFVVLVHENPARGKYPLPKILRSGELLKISAGKNRTVAIEVAKLV